MWCCFCLPNNQQRLLLQEWKHLSPIPQRQPFIPSFTIPILSQFRQRIRHTGKKSPLYNSHSAFIIACNHGNYFFVRKSIPFFIENVLTSLCPMMSFQFNNFCFSTFPSPFHPDGSIAVSPINKVTLSLISSLTLPWMTLTFFHPLMLLLLYSMLLPVIFFQTVLKELFSWHKQGL